MIDYSDPNDPNYDPYWGDKELSAAPSEVPMNDLEFEDVEKQYLEEVKREAEQEQQIKEEMKEAAQEWDEFAIEHPEEAAAIREEVSQSLADISKKQGPGPQSVESATVTGLDDPGEIPF